MARRCDSRVASLRFFWAPVFARAWRALNLSARSLAFEAASEVLGAVDSGSDVAFSGEGSGCEGASAGGAAASGISSASSAVALVLRFFAGGILSICGVW